MCRLLAIISTEPTTVAQALGDIELEEFTNLSRFHSDGWGAAWEENEHAPTIYKSVVAAYKDDKYQQFVNTWHAEEFMLHLRWASKGMCVSAQNAHPFARNGVAMIHNGSISPIEQINSLLDDTSLSRLQGTTDTERYFSYILQCARTTGNFENGLVKAVENMKRKFYGHSLNAMLMHNKRIYVVNVHAGATLDLSKYPERQCNIPWQHDSKHYYNLAASWHNSTLVVASTGIQDGEWQPIKDESIVVLSREQGVPIMRTLWEG